MGRGQSVHRLPGSGNLRNHRSPSTPPGGQGGWSAPDNRPKHRAGMQHSKIGGQPPSMRGALTGTPSCDKEAKTPGRLNGRPCRERGHNGACQTRAAAPTRTHPHREGE
ncbi:hypothetical protein H696_04679 [Fonticula alba]|uniref:Uncharacterized protein n=1 Tax=Fonticula alba TaxID=691883 RepID=A0A058Z2A4_FONAL|nr:hypothetical protein H696_04679 [Fonticula alba]KCV68390.1 hypothetical protein H696_04679 [Fonticula alba]|eukprot:XP_009496822.1 hypothetical protein H696_04679 [Fonticula alba]